MCWWMGFGIFCSLNKERLCHTERLFLNIGTKSGTASQKYCEQVVGIVKPHLQELQMHMRAEGFSAYGLRKGAATHEMQA